MTAHGSPIIPHALFTLPVSLQHPIAPAQVHDKVNAAWADGTIHAAEIVEERVRRGGAEKSTRPEDKEYYVHYIDCA